jgi:hypothetical protein
VKNPAIQVSECAHEGRGIAPEVRLFRHIILHAVMEAIYGSGLTYENSAGIKFAALRWFHEADEDFRFICACADLHPEIVRTGALAYIRSERARNPAPSERPRLHNFKRGERLAA